MMKVKLFIYWQVCQTHTIYLSLRWKPALKYRSWKSSPNDCYMKKTKRKDKNSSSTDAKAMSTKHRNPRKGPKCHHCGKIGHIKRDCWELMKKPEKSTPSWNGKNRSKMQNACIAEQEEEKEEIISLVAENVLTANRKSNWIVDSGATCHMCNKEELFSELSSLEIPQDITVGNGYSVQAIGKGTVILEMNISDNKNVV